MQKGDRTVWSYRTLLTESGVRVQVPNRSQFMRFIPAHTFDSENGSVVVPAHWQSGMTVDGKTVDTVIFNRHFYGFDSDDLGRKFTAILKVVEKREVGGDRVYTMVDIHKTNEPTVADLKISPEGDGILIEGTRTRINIIHRRSVRKPEAQPAQSA